MKIKSWRGIMQTLRFHIDEVDQMSYLFVEQVVELLKGK